MTEHTPTPWRVEKGTGLVWGDCTIFEDGTPDRLGIPVTDGQLERPWGKGCGPTYDEMEANAAFIVKAVNSHAEMDRLLAEAADELNNSPRMRSMDIGAKITAFRLQLQKGHGDPVGRAVKP